jgi:hypothetical protein
MSTTIFSQEYSEKKERYVTATVVNTKSNGEVSRYKNVSRLWLSCGVYVIYTTKGTFTLPATNVELYITVED